MAWRGEQIREIAKSKKVTINKLAESIGVSRQAVNDWINGIIPKGDHLISLCRQLGVEPNIFFSSERAKTITIPLHRKRGTAKITDDVKGEALELAAQYETLFRQAPAHGIFPVLRIDNRSETVAKEIANSLRELSGIGPGQPMDYHHTFALLEKLGIVAIFRTFPDTIKSYAFHTRIHDHRVVFVNVKTNLLDLIFPLLHEAVHCLGEDQGLAAEYDEAEEVFCDQVANYVQFPNEYANYVFSAVSGRSKALQINKLKDFSRQNAHALYGIALAVKRQHPHFTLDVGGADTNLKKNFPSIGHIVFKNEDPRTYVATVKDLSPRFVAILVNQLPGLTNRKLAELLGLPSELDAKAVRDELMRLI